MIARVHGIATAAGCQLVASCDLAIAADTARFATPGVNIGLFCSTPMVALSRAVGRKAAMEMLLTGDMVDAPRAAALGLVNHAVPEAELDGAVWALARRIAGKSAAAVGVGKPAFHHQADLPLAEAYGYASAVMARNMAERDASGGDRRLPAKARPGVGRLIGSSENPSTAACRCGRHSGVTGRGQTGNACGPLWCASSCPGLSGAQQAATKAVGVSSLRLGIMRVVLVALPAAA